MVLQEEKLKHINEGNNHKWSENDLYDQLIGELQDLIYWEYKIKAQVSKKDQARNMIRQ